MSYRHSMIARLIALGAVMLVTSGSQVSCNSGGTAIIRDDDLGSGNGPTFSTTLLLRDSSGTETTRFGRGELITFELTVRNRTPQPQTVSLSSTLTHQLFVFRNGASNPAWISTTGFAFPTVVTPLNFAANETKVMTFTWNQVTDSGNVLPRGTFEARGAVAAVGVFAPANDYLAPHELASNLREFTID